MTLNLQSRTFARAKPRPDGEGASRLLSGMLIGVCCASAGFLAMWPSNPQQSRTPAVFEKAMAGENIVYADVTLTPQDGSRRIKKRYTDRIEPASEVISLERRKPETQTRAIRLKAQPAKANGSCKPGRARNAEGQCGRWPAASRDNSGAANKFSR